MVVLTFDRLFGEATSKPGICSVLRKSTPERGHSSSQVATQLVHSWRLSSIVIIGVNVSNRLAHEP